MTSSATNKQPLLVDRPLHEWVSIGGTAALSSATNFTSLIPSGVSLLVDCTGNDGAVIDGLSVLITEASTTQSIVLVFLSSAGSPGAVTAANTGLIASAAIPGGNVAGQRVNISLPPISVPVPPLASPAATVATYPSELDKKNTGLYVPADRSLYVGVSTALSAPSAATRVIVAAQGGFF